MKKTMIIATLCFMVLLNSLLVAAVPQAPSPLCEVKGVIASVEFKEAYNESCVELGICPTDTELFHPARYVLKIVVENSTYLNGSTDYSTCDVHHVGRKETFLIDQSQVEEGDTFKVGQVIKGPVSYFYEKYSFEAYTLHPNVENDNVALISALVFLLIIVSVGYWLKKGK